MKIVFSKPYTSEDVTISEVELNLDKLTGDDLISVIDLLQTEGIMIVSPMLDQRVQINLAAKSCSYASEFLRGLPINDFAKICQGVQNFLLN